MVMTVKILADQILPGITEVATPEVTGFLAMRGREYAGELMVVGRAVNRWTKGISPYHLRDDLCRLAYAEWVHRSVTENVLGATMDGKCPMLWVTSLEGKTNPDRHQFTQSPHDSDYNTRRSDFWAVIRDVVGRLGIANVDEDDNWPSHLIWSNLYKIAPFAGGNPDRELQTAQFNGCANLLAWELEEYRPRRLLFLTGWNKWADRFLERITQDLTLIEGRSFVEATGHVKCGAHFARCVVACHPGRKKRVHWVNEVVAAFG